MAGFFRFTAIQDYLCNFAAGLTLTVRQGLPVCSSWSAPGLKFIDGRVVQMKHLASPDRRHRLKQLREERSIESDFVPGYVNNDDAERQRL
jgi:hypothetical protein